MNSEFERRLSVIETQQVMIIDLLKDICAILGIREKAIEKAKRLEVMNGETFEQKEVTRDE